MQGHFGTIKIVQFASTRLILSHMHHFTRELKQVHQVMFDKLQLEECETISFLRSKPYDVGERFSIGRGICHHFEELQTIHHGNKPHAMPLEQAARLKEQWHLSNVLIIATYIVWSISTPQPIFCKCHGTNDKYRITDIYMYQHLLLDQLSV